MPFLKEIRFKSGTELPDEFPFTIPIIQSLESLVFESSVTFFVGENGSGKSTLLEAIAAGMKCPAMGAADINRDPLMAPATKLAKYLIFSRDLSPDSTRNFSQNASQKRTPRHKLFFRAEDAIGFTRRLMESMSDLSEMEAHFDETLSGYGKILATGVTKSQRAAMETRYGNNPDARSHGEWFIEMLKTRIHDNGLYLLDEPEAPLSPIHQLSLLSIINDQASRNCQFIIATHSPILMALPGARILNFGEYIEPIDWQDVEHVAITRAFLNDPRSFLRHL